jgi:hypothetical protein
MILSVAVATNMALFSYAVESSGVDNAVEKAFTEIDAMLEHDEFVINVVIDPLKPEDQNASDEVERLLSLRYNIADL